MATVTLSQATSLPAGPASISGGGYTAPYRPWLALYGLRLRVSGGQQEDEQVAPIQRLLPEELLLLIFSALPTASLAAAQCVCRAWRRTGDTPRLWQTACLEAFYATTFDASARLLRTQYRGSWKRMFLERPHLRFDGLYVSRNSYIRTGLVEWQVRNPCHLVCYFRYFRFLPNGDFLYRTSPEVPAKVARSLRAPRPHERSQDIVQQGRYKLEGDRLYCALRYANSTSTEVRSRLRLRSTVPGANNRLDLLSIVSHDSTAGTAAPILDLNTQDDDDQGPGGQLRRHRRGMSACIFLPWHSVQDTVLNLPVHKMDFYVPG